MRIGRIGVLISVKVSVLVGVKLLNPITRENEKLKKALQHIVSTEIEGHAVVLVSEELRVKL